MERTVLPFDAPILPLLTPDEIFANAGQSLLSRLHEDRRVEYKSRIDPRRLGDYFSMWSNTSPAGGLIVIGIANDGAVSGCASLSPHQLNEIEKSAKNYCPDSRE